jgi:hypothetical protein
LKNRAPHWSEWLAGWSWLCWLSIALFFFKIVPQWVPMTCGLLGLIAWSVREQERSKGKRMSFKIDLNATVRDKITGYEGSVIARTEWLYACRRYTVQARRLHDGKPVDAICCDEDQLEIIEAPAEHHVVKDTGGPTPIVSRGATVTR